MLWSKINRNVVYRGLYSYRQRVRVITRFLNIFFVLFLRIKRVHCQVRVGVFSCQDKYLFRYLWYCGNKTNRVWFSVVCTLVDNDTCYNGGQNAVQQIELHHKARAFSY